MPQPKGKKSNNLRRGNVLQKVDWRLSNLITSQKRIEKKIKDAKMITKLRTKDEMSLRSIGRKLGMSGQQVNNILKIFFLDDSTKTKNNKKK